MTRSFASGVELDVATLELRVQGEAVPVEPQVFDLLAYLIDHRDRVVPKEELLDNLAFFPKFEVAPSAFSHKQYCEYIEEKLAVETPAAYGLHPNSEIGFMTRQADALFAAVAELQPRASGGGGGMSLGERVKRLLDDITEKLPDLFPMNELEERTADERSPYAGVFLQECERMNMLLFELKRSLGELDMGLKGDLSITEAMEALMTALYDDRVPVARVFLRWND